MKDFAQEDGRARAERMREKAVAVAMKRKEEYLGARVPKELRDKVIRRAKDQGIPVSILIRNILTEAFQEVDSSSSPMLGTAASVDVNQGKYSEVLGWDKITLNKAFECAECGKGLHAGQQVSLGLGASRPVILCGDCKE